LFACIAAPLLTKLLLVLVLLLEAFMVAHGKGLATQ
jgi:hypothetical protein